MKRVMIVTNSLSGGGAERSMNLICNELSSRGWVISLVPINSSSEDQVVPKCTVFALNRPWQSGLFRTLNSMWRFNQVVGNWKPDVIVLNCDLPELFGATVLGRQNLVVLEHSSSPWFQRQALGKVVRKILVFRLATWATVSSHLSIWSTNEKPAAVLQNPITTEIINKPRIVGDEISRLLYVGRLSREKRPEFALKIAQLVQVELEIMGDGGLRDQLEEQAAQKSINVNFRGRVTKPWAEITPGDLLIVPSSVEGDGLVIIEAMQTQIPLLVADIPDLRRFEFPERNYCRDVDDFVKRINQYSKNLSQLLIPANISRPILGNRSLSNVGDSWIKFLIEI
jgi:GalNAc-alpha-(1->4)-GalNAc-alpha-(1->3)-diNAcBac-PP-undecaprenol alpha-1,4-N-acetyl-D-galactosaminyltransferase